MKINNLILKVVLIVSFQLSIVNCFSQSDSLEVHTVNGKEYYIHIVSKGESLYAIHKKYDIPQDVIKKENPSVLDGLSIGEKIFIPVKKEKLPQSVDGNFISHTVQKRQTLYAIARIYKIKQREIIAVNPEAKDGLKEGQIIKIPVKNIKKDALVKPVLTNSQYLTHQVQSGETLYSLSKQYVTTVDSIKQLNNGLKGGLKLGETIYVPQLVEPAIYDSLKVEIDSDIYDSIVKKSIYKIGLMLPFYLDENEELVENRSGLQQKGIYSKSKFAIEFYKGFLMGLEELNSDSVKFQVFVYDTKGKDSLCTKNVLKKEECENLDLIVGPLYHSNFIIAAEFAKENHIPIVSPVKQNNKILLGNPYVFKSIPSKPSMIDLITTLTVDSFKVDNLIAIEDDKAKEKSLIDLYKQAYNNRIAEEEDTLIYAQITTVNLTSSFGALLSHLKVGENNVLFVPSSNSTFITNLFNYLVNTLNKSTYKNTSFTLIGLEEWLKYENIDLEYFERLNVHVPVVQHIAYKDSLTEAFIQQFISKNKTYPSKVSFLAYDVANYFVGNLKTYGSVFLIDAPKNEFNNYSIKHSFFKTGIESGYENINCYILRFNDYTLERVY